MINYHTIIPLSIQAAGGNVPYFFEHSRFFHDPVACSRKIIYNKLNARFIENIAILCGLLPFVQQGNGKDGSGAMHEKPSAHAPAKGRERRFYEQEKEDYQYFDRSLYGDNTDADNGMGREYCSGRVS